MTELEQTLAGENKVLRDLLKKAGNVIDAVLEDNDPPSYEVREMVELVAQIHDAVCGGRDDLLSTP